MKLELHISPTAEEMAVASAAFIVDYVTLTLAEQNSFSVALSGGSTPASTYRHLATPPLREQIAWDRVHIFWSDERCFPANDPESNYRLANETLLQRVPLPAENIHRLRGELDPSAAADLASQDIVKHFSGRLPSFDLILLGLGEDGHTASLFPSSSALDAGNELVTANYIGKLDAWRLTFSFPLLNVAKQVTFLATGEKKAQMVKEVIEDRNPRLPATGVQPPSGNVDWFLDRAAAQKLKPQTPSD